MGINIRLKMALLEKGKTQRELAHRSGVHESRISKFIRGWEKPTLKEKEAIAKVLRMPVDELFEPRVAA